MINTIAEVYTEVKDYETTRKGRYILSVEAYTRFSRLCGLVDELASEFPGSFVKFKVLPELLDATVSVLVDDIEFQDGRSHPFFERIKDADSLTFVKSKADNKLEIKLGVYNLWERTRKIE